LITQPHHSPHHATSSRRSHIYCHQAFPPAASSPFLLSRRSPFSDLPIRAGDPSLRGGEACDGCNLNSKPRLLVNWWSRTVQWNNHLFLVIWRSAVQIPAVATYLLHILYKFWICNPGIRSVLSGIPDVAGFRVVAIVPRL